MTSREGSTGFETSFHIPNTIDILEGKRIVDLQKLQDFYGISHKFHIFNKKKNGSKASIFFFKGCVEFRTIFGTIWIPSPPRYLSPNNRRFENSRCPQLLSPEPRVAAIFSDEDPPGSEPCNWTATGLIGVSRDRYPSRGGVSQRFFFQAGFKPWKLTNI